MWSKDNEALSLGYAAQKLLKELVLVLLNDLHEISLEFEYHCCFYDLLDAGRSRFFSTSQI